MEFHVLSRNTWVPDSGKNTVYLKIDNWNDYSFITLFHMSLHDENGQLHDIGGIKIGFKGQTTETATYEKLPNRFGSVGDEYFSLGSNIDFYRNMVALPEHLCKRLLVALRDIVLQPDIIEEIKEEKVFSTSLLRSVSLSVLKGQWARVLGGQAELTDFKFKFARPESEHFGGIELSFVVEVGSKPNTNIHSVIGRNGVGKTTSDLLTSTFSPDTGPEL